jgi:hypothetical protein
VVYTVPLISFSKIKRRLKYLFGIQISEAHVVEFVALVFRKFREASLNKGDNFNGWYYMYRSHMERVTVHYVEFLTVMAHFEYIEIMDEGFDHKIKVRFKECYWNNSQKIDTQSLKQKIYDNKIQ